MDLISSAAAVLTVAVDGATGGAGTVAGVVGSAAVSKATEYGFIAAYKQFDSRLGRIKDSPQGRIVAKAVRVAALKAFRETLDRYENGDYGESPDVGHLFLGPDKKGYARKFVETNLTICVEQGCQLSQQLTGLATTPLPELLSSADNPSAALQAALETAMLYEVHDFIINVEGLTRGLNDHPAGFEDGFRGKTDGTGFFALFAAGVRNTGQDNSDFREAAGLEFTADGLLILRGLQEDLGAVKATVEDNKALLIDVKASLDSRNESDAQSLATVTTLLANALAKNEELQGKLDASSREAVTDAVVSLPAQHVPQEKIEAAEAALAEGDTDLAKALYEEVSQEILEHSEQQQLENNQHAAQALRRKGALAFLNDTDEALEAFGRAVALDPDNAEGRNQLGHLYQRVGKLDDAIAAYERVLEIAQIGAADDALAAVAYGNLGIVYQTRGELDKAIEFYEKALKINEALGIQGGVAIQYGNLGNVYQTRGELDKAIEFLEKALKIDEALGSQEGMASDYGNLGNVYQTRGELDKAIEFHEKSLKINEALGRQEGMANAYGNLGNVYKTRGELDKAIEFYEKALKINEALGIQGGVANQYGNLGNVYQTRGELDKAIVLYEKSLKINEALGRQEGMATNYANLGNVYQTRGELDKAIEFHEKAIKIDEALGSQEGMAADYGNLGLVYSTRGELDKAIEFYEKSLKINEALERQEGMASDYGNLGNVYQTRGELDKARSYWEQSLAIFEKLGSPTAEKVRGWLDGLK